MYVRCGAELFVQREALLKAALPAFLTQRAPELNRLVADAEAAGLVRP